MYDEITPSLYSFDIVANTERAVSGNVSVETDKGWFRIPFGPIHLTAATRHTVDFHGHKRMSTRPRSAVQYVDFGSPIVLKSIFLENAATDVGDWKDVGLFQCYPAPTKPNDWYAIPSELSPYKNIPPGAKIIAARSVAPILSNNCAKPYVDARVLTQIAPAYPYQIEMPKTTSQIEVTIMPDGRAIDTQVLVSSGIPAFDQAAINAAMQSTYSPKIAFCKPTIGQYLFKVTFE